MIRFIDIRNQGTGSRFAFWSTVTDQFLEIAGEMAWESLDDLAEIVTPDVDFDRLKALCPGWVNDGKEDDLGGFYT